MTNAKNNGEQCATTRILDLAETDACNRVFQITRKSKSHLPDETFDQSDDLTSDFDKFLIFGIFLTKISDF